MAKKAVNKNYEKTQVYRLERKDGSLSWIFCNSKDTAMTPIVEKIFWENAHLGPRRSTYDLATGYAENKKSMKVTHLVPGAFFA